MRGWSVEEGSRTNAKASFTSLALTGDGCVFIHGEEEFFGRFGMGRESDELVRVEFDFPNQAARDQPQIIGVAAGAYHSLAASGVEAEGALGKARKHKKETSPYTFEREDAAQLHQFI